MALVRTSFLLGILLLALFGGFYLWKEHVHSQQQAQAAADQAALQAYRQEQNALAQSYAALVAKDATPAQFQAWQQQNAPRLAAQHQFAINLGAKSSLAPIPLIAAPNIPPNASPALKDFLTTQATLANAHAQIHNQLVDDLPSNPTPDQIRQMQQKEADQFTQQQAANLKLQAQRAQNLAAESAQQPQSLPPPLALPPNLSPQLAAYLTAKDQLMREQIQLNNQLLTATPAARDAALQAWQKKNAARFQHLQQLAQNLSQPSPPQKN